MYGRIYQTFKEWQFEITIQKSTPQQVLDKCSNAYTTLAREALKKLLAFAIAYLCETGFSDYVLTKIKWAYSTGMQSRRF